MKRAIFGGLGLVVFAGVCAFAGLEASGASETIVFRPHVPFHRLPADEPAVDAPDDDAHVKLTGYITAVMESWPSGYLPTVDELDLGHDIAAAALEKPSSDPSQDAVLLAALAYWEGARFASYVDDGSCNDPNWREAGIVEGRHLVRGVVHEFWTSQELMLAGGDCDHALARSLFQIHPIVDRASSVYDLCNRDALSDRRTAASCALALARMDPSLCSYTGERGDYCPKAEERLAWARKAIAAWPYHP